MRTSERRSCTTRVRTGGTHCYTFMHALVVILFFVFCTVTIPVSSLENETNSSSYSLFSVSSSQTNTSSLNSSISMTLTPIFETNSSSYSLLSVSSSQTNTSSLNSSISMTLTPILSSTATVTPANTSSFTISPPPTTSPTVTFPKSTSLSLSASLVATNSDTVTPPQTPTPTFSSSVNRSRTASLKDTWSLSITPPNTSSVSFSITPPSTPSHTITPAPTASHTISPPRTPTDTVSPPPTPSSTLSPPRTPTPSITPPSTPTLSDTLIPSASDSVSASVSPSFPPTVSETLSPPETPTRSLTHSISLALSLTPTVTPPSTPTISRSSSVSISLSQTFSPPPTASSSQTPTTSASLSHSLSSTVTPPHTASLSLSSSHSLTRTISPPPTPTPSRSFSLSFSWSASESGSFSPSGSASWSISLSSSHTKSKTTSASASTSTSTSISESSSISPSSTESMSRSLSLSVSRSVSNTASVSIPASQSLSISFSTSMSFTSSPSISPTTSSSATLSSSPSLSPSKTLSPSQTPTLSMPPTATPTLSTSISLTVSPTLPPTATPSFSSSQSVTVSPTLSVTATPTVSGTLTPPPTASTSATLSSTTSQSLSLSTSPSSSFSSSKSESDSISISPSPSLVPTLSVSLSYSPTTSQTFPTFSATETYELTTSAIPPTTSVPITETATLITSCPDCLHGICTTNPPYICRCFRNAVDGYWVGYEVEGAVCDRCRPYFYGPDCRAVCPGGLCAPCNFHGNCSDGVNGTGRCTCFNDTEHGFFAGSRCQDCSEEYYGDDCKSKCDCSGHGKCLTGPSNSGACRCYDGFDGERCERCVFGRYGPDCLECPGGVGNPCSGHGQCDPVNGTCRCYDYEGVSCSIACRASSSTCNREPCFLKCVEPDMCDKRTGLCVCPLGRAGAICDRNCTGLEDNNGTLRWCSGHGHCVAEDGSCDCYKNSTHGFWDGENCSKCQEKYSIDSNCEKACPTSFKNNKTCGGIGECRNGRCHCHNLSICGSSCDEDPCQPRYPNCSAGQYGLDCEHNCTCVIQNTANCSKGREGSGNCTCRKGYGGLRCENECPKANGTHCNGGNCSAETGECECRRGLAGANCSIPCPGGVDCNGHGRCFDGVHGNGTCACNGSYGGPLSGCRYKCADTCVLPFGTCQNDGNCSCFGNFDVATNCTGCKRMFSGPRCTARCRNGTTVGTQCICHENYGGPTCENECPRHPTYGVCSVLRNGGTCDKNGTCQCNSPFLGVSCGCLNAECALANPRKVCSPKGSCVCGGGFDGADCERCARNRWGPTCEIECRCGTTINGVFELHGTCTPLTGTCKCDNDDIRGYYTGEFCTVCQRGYFGRLCRQRSLVSTQMGSLIHLQPVSVDSRSIVNQKLYHFPVTDAIIAVGSRVTLFSGATQKAANATRSLSLLSLAGCRELVQSFQENGNLFLVVSCSPVPRAEFYFVSASDLLISLSNTSYPPGRLPLATSVDRPNLIPLLSFYFVRPQHQVGPPQLNTFTQVYQNRSYGTYCFIDRTAESGANVVHCYTKDWEFKLLLPGRVGEEAYTDLPRLKTVDAAIYSPYIDKIIVFGIFTGCRAYLVSFEPQLKMSVDPIFDNFVSESWTSAQCTKILAAYIPPEEPSTVLVTVLDGASVVHFLRFTLKKNNFDRISTFDSPDSPGIEVRRIPTVTLHRDPASATLYVALNDETVTLVKIAEGPNEFSNLGSQRLSSLSVAREGIAVVDMIFNDEKKIGYLLWKAFDRPLDQVVLTQKGVLVLRIISYVLQSIHPPISDMKGGTIMTLYGRGFLANVSTALCSFSGHRVNATMLSTTVAQCVSPPTLATCNQQAVDISLFGDLETSSRIALSRTREPTLALPSPPRRQRYNAPQPVILNSVKTAFLNRSFSVCIYQFQETSEKVILPSTFIDDRTIQCEALQPMREGALAWVDIALDGYVPILPEKTRNTTNFFNVTYVGEATHLIVSANELPSVTAEAMKETRLPVLKAAVTDNRKMELGEYFRGYAAVFVGASVIPDPPLNESALPPNIRADRERRRQLRNAEPCVLELGACYFANLFLELPHAGYYNITFEARYVLSDQQVLFSSTLSLAIVPGKVASLLIQQPGAFVDKAGSFTDGRTPVVYLQDIAGNNITFLEREEAINARITRVPTFDESQLSVGVRAALPPAIADAVPVKTNTGEAKFGALRIQDAAGGYIYRIKFTLGDTNISAMSHDIRFMCPSDHVSIWGSTLCTPCEPKFRCNGSYVVNLPMGFWRPSYYVGTIYACAPAKACPGGEAPRSCETGYEGVLCSTCSSTFGKGQSGSCVSCRSRALSTAVFALLCIVTLIGMTVIVVMSAQNWKRESRAMVVLQLFVSQMQNIVFVSALRWGYPQEFLEISTWLSSVFMLRIFDVSFAECSLGSGGSNYITKFGVYSAMPFFAAFLGAFAWLVIYLFPRIFYLSDVLDRDKHHAVQKDTESRTNQVKDTSDINTGSDGGKLHVYRNNQYVFLATTSLQALLFFSHPASLYYSLLMLNCVTVEKPDGSTDSRLSEDLSIDCNSATYENIYFPISLTISSLLLVGVPAMYTLAYTVHSRVFPREKLKRRQLFSFFVQGLKPQGWYWPAATFLRKGIAVLIVVRVKEGPIDSYLLMWMFALNIPLLYFVMPYLDKKNNYLEGLALSVQVVVINILFLIETFEDAVVAEALTWTCFSLLLMVCVVYLYFAAYRLREKLMEKFHVHVLHEITEFDEEEEENEVELEAVVEEEKLGADVKPEGKKRNGAKKQKQKSTSKGIPEFEVDVPSDTSGDTSYASSSASDKTAASQHSEDRESRQSKSGRKRHPENQNLSADGTTYYPTFNVDAQAAVRRMTPMQRLAWLRDPHRTAPTNEESSTATVQPNFTESDASWGLSRDRTTRHKQFKIATSVPGSTEAGREDRDSLADTEMGMGDPFAAAFAGESDDAYSTEEERSRPSPPAINSVLQVPRRREINKDDI